MILRSLLRRETNQALRVAARALFDDPLFRHIHTDPDTRLASFTREYAAYVRHVYRPCGLCEIAEVDGTVSGLALWLPPDAGDTAWRERLALPALARAVGLRRLPSVLRDYRAFDEAWPDGRFWYLGLLAVDPAAQGAGLGRALVRAGLERADRDGVGVFLETGTLDNVRFYERLGFGVAQVVPLPHGPTHWAMWRPPQSPPDNRL